MLLRFVNAIKHPKEFQNLIIFRTKWAYLSSIVVVLFSTSALLDVFQMYLFMVNYYILNMILKRGRQPTDREPHVTLSMFDVAFQSHV